MSPAKLPSLPVDRLLETGRATAGGVPEGLDALLLGEIARHAGGQADPACRARRQQACHAGRGAALLRPRRAGVGLSCLGRRALRPRGAQRRDHRAAHRHACRAHRPRGRRYQAAYRADDRQCAVAEGSAARLYRRHEPQTSAGQRADHAGADRAPGDLRLYARRHRHRSRAICRARRHPRSLSARRRSDPTRFLRRYAGIDQGLRSRHAADRGAARVGAALADERDDADARSHQRLPPALRRSVRPGHRRRPALRVDLGGAPASGHGTLAAAVPRSVWSRSSTICRRPA